MADTQAKVNADTMRESDSVPSPRGRRYLVFAIAAAGVVCGAGSFWVYLGPATPTDPIVFEPTHIDVRQPVREGERVEVTFKVRNTSPKPARIVEIVASCACMEVGRAEKRADGSRYELASGEAATHRVYVDTDGAEGAESHPLWVRYEFMGNTYVNETDIRILVLPALRNLSGPILVDAGGHDQLTTDVRIGDGFPDPGIEIGSIETSGRERVRVQLDDVADRRVPISPREGRSQTELTERYRARLTITPTADESAFQEELVFHPKDKRYPSLRVPVVCRGSSSAGPRRLFPSELVVPGSGRGTLQKELVYFADESEVGKGALQIRKCPRYLTGEVIKHETRWLIRVSISLPVSSDDGGVIELADGTGHTVVTIPVVVLPHT
jgi:hypothetical protein